MLSSARKTSQGSARSFAAAVVAVIFVLLTLDLLADRTDRHAIITIAKKQKSLTLLKLLVLCTHTHSTQNLPDTSATNVSTSCVRSFDRTSHSKT